MSANNYLNIKRYKEGWMVSNVDIEGGGFFITDKSFTSLEKAIRAANQYQTEHEVEYGLQITLGKPNGNKRKVRKNR